MGLVLLLVPLMVYVGANTRYFLLHGPDAAGFIGRQVAIAQFHEEFSNPHIQGSRAPTWPIMIKPFYYFRSFSNVPDPPPDNSGGLGPGGTAVASLGNPVLWWGWLLAAPFLLYLAIRRRSLIAAGILVAYASVYVPWIFISRDEFIWYYLPALPVMALGMGAALQGLPRRVQPALTRSYLVAALLAAIAFSPLWLGLAVPNAWTDRLYWLRDWRYTPSLLGQCTPEC